MLLILSETKTDSPSRFHCLERLGYDGLAFIPSLGRSGGLVAVWRSGQGSVSLIRSDRQFLHLHISLKGRNPFLLTAIYAVPSPSCKLLLWQELMSLSSSVSAPWVVLGDFNDILSVAERVGGSGINRQRISQFQERINDCHLSDLGFVGPKFTWKGPHLPNCARLFERLDRALLPGEISYPFEQSETFNLGLGVGPVQEIDKMGILGKCCSIQTLLLGAMFGCIIGLHMKVDATPYSSNDIDTALKLLNKPALKTIQSDAGDIIDCVDIYKQPAFDHPTLKNNKIQMAPSFVPRSQDSNAKNDESVSAKPVISQVWHRNGTCPDGTIPHSQNSKENLLRAHSLHRFGTKPSLHFTNSSLKPNVNKLTLPNFANRSAALLATLGYNYIGAQAAVNVWNPRVDLPDDFTTSQMWLKSGNGDVFESVEAGWVVNPKLYGDKATRLFAYWTRDSYKSTGCFDLICTGFVQTGTQVALGAATEPVLYIFGPRYIVKIGIFLDPSTSNWWLKVVDNIPIGYWPPSLFKT
ncbi:hypothetical protein K1719_022589 [Acacia pycnantha]|nr:hypothetical protein K1719_022589 [Acacia pycnantha]